MAKEIDEFRGNLIRDNLQWIRATITRMSDYSRSTKTWTITIATAIALYLTQAGTYHPLIALPPIVIFMILDSYYLALERHFRNELDRLSELALAGKLEATGKPLAPRYRLLLPLFFRASIAPANLAFYGLFIAISVVVGILVVS